MTTYNDVFGNATVPPSEYGYTALVIVGDTTVEWIYNSDGGITLAKITELNVTLPALTLKLPDATQVSTGEDFLLRNTGANDITIADANGVTITILAPGIAKYFYLTDNTTVAGVFAVVTYGAGTSIVDAGSLIGYGIIAIGATLNQSHPVSTSASVITLGAANRASVFNYTGGSGTLPLTSASTLGDNYFVLVRNSGTGTLTIDPNGTDTIDGQATLPMQPGESLILVCSGVGWYTVGYGRSVQFNFTQLVKDVSAGGSFTLTQAEAANKLLTFIGNPSTSVSVVVPNVVSVYYAQSSISTAQIITLKTATGTGVVVPQGQRIIAICDSTNVVSATSVSSNTTLSLVDGSVSIPSINFATQTNTGIYKFSTLGIGISVNGVSRYSDDGTTITIGTLSGLVKRTVGVESAAVDGTDFISPSAIHSATSKAPPVDADELPMVDSAASFALKKLTWANMKASVFSAWGALISAATAKTTPVDADAFAFMDSAASNATKQLTWANLKATLTTYFDTLYATASSLVTQSATAITSAGTAPNFTITPGLAQAAYAANQRYRVKFHAAGVTGSNTVNLSGLGAKSVKQYDASGAKVSGIITANQLADIEYDGVDWVILDPLPPVITMASSKIQSISAAVAGNSLTISASILTLDFRSTTLGNGTITTVTGTPANLVISSGSTLGTVSGQPSRIAVLALNNAGTIELAAVNIAGGNQLDETNLITTTAEGGAGAADSANVIYSATARSSVAYRVIGYIESTQTTAGTWATAPSTIQGAGGISTLWAGFASGFSANGYQKLPTGLIIQWGVATMSGGAMTITLPMTFPNACVSVVGNNRYSSTGMTTNNIVATEVFSTSQIKLTSNAVIGQAFWIAIGY